MAKITRPGQREEGKQAKISESLIGKAGVGYAEVGKAVSKAGTDFQNTKVGALAAQVGALVSQVGQDYFSQSKRAFQTTVYTNSMTKATEEFAKAEQERIKRATDENGNPTYESLSEDLGRLGGEIRDKYLDTIADPEIANKFQNNFNSHVSNRQISSLRTARQQQIDFGRASLTQGLDSLKERAIGDDISNIGTYEAQAQQILNDNLTAGVISKQNYEALSKTFSESTREELILQLIQTNPSRARQILEGNAEALGIAPEKKNELQGQLIFKERANQLENEQIEKETAIARDNYVTKLAEDIDNKIDTDVLKVDELLNSSKILPSGIYNKLSRKYLDKAKKRELELQRSQALASQLKSGNGAVGYTDKEIESTYQRMIDAATISVNRNLTLTEKAELAGIFKTEVKSISEQIGSTILSGEAVKAIDAINAYTYIRDKKLTTLGNKFDKDARSVAELMELYVERGGQTPEQALIKARERIIEGKDDPIQQARLKEFKKSNSGFAPEDLRDTIHDAFQHLPGYIDSDVEQAVEDGEIDAEFESTFLRLAEDEYLRSGDLKIAGRVAAAQMDKVYAKSAFSDKVMVLPPEKLFPQYTQEELINDLTSDLQNLGVSVEDLQSETSEFDFDDPAGSLVQRAANYFKGLNQENILDKVRLHSDAMTLGKTIRSIDPTTGQVVDQNLVSYALTDLEGNPIIDPRTGSQARWFPSEDKIEEQRRFKTEEILEKARQTDINQRQARVTATKLGSPVAQEDFDRRAAQQGQDVRAEVQPGKLDRAISIISPKANPAIKNAIVENQEALEEFGINNPARLEAFLAQMSHESAGFTALVEKRSDASAERKYGAGTRVGKVLGNTQPGDGAKYKGRGIIQLTGRFNYRKFGNMLGIDLENNPDLAADPQIAIKIAAAFWQDKGLNELADKGNFKEITRRINGGYNGLADRQRRLRKIKGKLD